jgi:hypothetical protein
VCVTEREERQRSKEGKKERDQLHIYLWPYVGMCRHDFMCPFVCVQIAQCWFSDSVGLLCFRLAPI